MANESVSKYSAPGWDEILYNGFSPETVERAHTLLCAANNVQDVITPGIAAVGMLLWYATTGTPVEEKECMSNAALLIACLGSLSGALQYISQNAAYVETNLAHGLDKYGEKRRA